MSTSRHEPRIAEIESRVILPAAEIAARTRLSAARRRVGINDNWTPPAGAKPVPVSPTTLEDRLRAGRSRIAQEGSPAAQIAAPAPIAPNQPVEALLGLPGDAVVAPAALDREALFAAFVKSARGNLQTVDICNFNAAFATARDAGAAFVAPPLAPTKQTDTTPANPGQNYDPCDLM